MCVYVILVYMCRLMIVTHWDSFKGASYDSKNVLMNILHSKNINIKIYLFLIPRLVFEEGMKILKLWDTPQVYKLLNICKALKY